MGTILVRYVGEIGIKGKNRALFVKQLRRNVRAALRRACSHDIEVRQVWSEGQRLIVEVDDADMSAALDVLQTVFGVASLSPASRVASDLEAMREQALALARQADLRPPATFCVRARRADKTFPLRSPQINQEVGGAVYEATGARVDLSGAADLTIGIEVREEGTLVYGQVVDGPGGMPLNTQGRVFALLSGGIDSPAAAWLMMRRGCGVIPLHFVQSETEKDKVLAHCHTLSRWAHGWEIKPVWVDHRRLMEPIVERLYQLGEERWTCVLCKRTMVGEACRLASTYRVQALVMGDSLGQVASQTLHNLAAVSTGATLPVLRPLIAYDKPEIIALARRIGTFDTSIQETAPCPFLPAHPMTMAHLERLNDILAALNME